MSNGGYPPPPPGPPGGPPGGPPNPFYGQPPPGAGSAQAPQQGNYGSPGYGPPGVAPQGYGPPPGARPPQAYGAPGYPQPGYGPPPGYPQAGMIAGYGAPNANAPYGYDPITGLPFSDKSKVIAGLLQLFVGWCGAGRFYTGHHAIAIAQMAVFFGGAILGFFTCGITLFVAPLWHLIDAILMFSGKVPDAQGRPLRDGT